MPDGRCCTEFPAETNATYFAEGASFEILSLNVTSGGDIAFAHAFRRSGTPEKLKQDPARRLRLTIDLRKQRGRWAVTH